MSLPTEEVFFIAQYEASPVLAFSPDGEGVIFYDSFDELELDVPFADIWPLHYFDSPRTFDDYRYGA